MLDRNSRTFDPAVGSGATVVASFSGTQTHIAPDWQRELDAIDQDRRERDMRGLGFGQRSSLCG